MVALAATRPGKLAEIEAVPAATAVTNPVELTVATAGVLDVQVTWSVMSSVLEGWFPCDTVPVAVSCAVCPIARVCDVGVTEMVLTWVFVQPAIGSKRHMSPSALKQ